MQNSTPPCVIFTYRNVVAAQTVGGKFSQLAQLASTFLLPPGLCLGVEAFRWGLRTQPQIEAHLNETMNRLFQARGYQLGAHTAGLQKVLRGLEVPPDIANELYQSTQEAIGTERDIFPLVVRSSAVSEDEAGHTQAGIYDSYLGLMDWSAVLQAITRCWASYYSHRAILHRILLDDFNPAPQMAVIIQKMVIGQWSGVAFSRSPIPIPLDASEPESWGYVEYTAGTAEHVAAGEECAGSAFFSFDNTHIVTIPPSVSPVSANSALIAACQMSRQLESYLGTAVDLEWTWTAQHGLWVLQARAASRSGRAEICSTIPYVCVHDLTDLRPDPLVDLGDCSTIYAHWSQKRGPLRQSAAAAGIALGGIAVVDANAAGMMNTTIAEHDALSRLGAPLLTMDAGPRLRQLVFAREESAVRLLDILQATPGSPWARRIFLLREYIDGSASLLSAVDKDGSVLIEFGVCSLPDLTRGVGRTWHLTISPTNALLPCSSWLPEMANYLDWLCAHAVQLADFTREQARYNPHLCLEWVVMKDELVLIDASYPSYTSEVSAIMPTTAHRVLSFGAIHGRVIRVEPDSWMVELSNSAAISLDEISPEVFSDAHVDSLLALADRTVDPGAVIVTPRPLAMLAVLVGRVAGFIFEDGPLLCHLGILLREHGIPAILSHDAYAQLHDGQVVTFSNGRFMVDG